MSAPDRHSPRDYARTTLRELVRISSVNPGLVPGAAGEAEVAELVASELRAAGLEVRILEAEPGRPSVLARLPGDGSGPSLLLNAHLDTVGVGEMERPFSGEIRDGRLYGRGAYDMKGGLAAVLTAARWLAAASSSGRRLTGDLWVAAVADEEAESRGTRDVLRRVRPDAAVVTEPTHLELCIAHKGFVWLELVTRGRAAHGSRPDLGVDANLAMARVLSEVEGLARELASGSRLHPLLGRPSLHVGELRGGTAPSVYAASCRATVERRTIPGEATEQILGELERCVRRAAREGTGVDVEVEAILARPPFETRADTPVSRAVARAATAVIGEPPEVTGQGPWMDAALFAEAGTDTVVIGPSGEGAHSREEWVELDSVYQLAEILQAAVRDYVGEGEGSGLSDGRGGPEA